LEESIKNINKKLREEMKKLVEKRKFLIAKKIL